MSTEPAASWLYRIAAISNFIVTLPALLAYDRVVSQLPPPAPNYPFLVWIWSGMAFLWGVSFWEISRDPRAKYPLIKYSYLEKTVTSLSVFVGFLAHHVPALLMVFVVFTDVIWIPFFVAAQVRVRARALGEPRVT
jgi:hypothetical protein